MQSITRQADHYLSATAAPTGPGRRACDACGDVAWVHRHASLNAHFCTGCMKASEELDALTSGPSIPTGMNR